MISRSPGRQGEAKLRRTDVHDELLSDLSLVIRMILPWQCQRGYFRDAENGLRKATRMLKRLEKAGWLSSHCCMLNYPFPSVECGPIYAWSPHDSNPIEFNAERVSYLARKRWKKTKVTTARFWFASKKARRLFGGRDLEKETPGLWSQRNHDLMATSIALEVKAKRPHVFAETKGEDFVAQLYKGDKLSDFVVGPNLLQPSLVFDAINQYSAAMCQSYYDRWGPESRQPTNLELW